MSFSALSSEAAAAALSISTTEPATTRSQEPAFICTICWQGQPQGSKPKLLGSSARIVCQACWCAVLDLSICWVCGECIVRGDEVVSLGWCFWHRSCFGCLFCKTRMSVPNTEHWGERQGRREYDEFGGSGGGTSSTVVGSPEQGCSGVELDEVPLCSVCKIETAGELQHDVIEKGLETVTRSDCGLSRDRLNMLNERDESRNFIAPQTKSCSPLGPRRLRRSRVQEIERDLTRYINDGSSDFGTDVSIAQTQMLTAKEVKSMNELQIDDEIISLEDYAYTTDMPQDGAVDSVEAEKHTHSDNEEGETGRYRSETFDLEDESDRDFYISIFYPLGQPAFKRSKTKPLPQWMRLLPNNFHRERENQNQRSQTRPSEPLQIIQELQILPPNTPIAIHAFESPLEDAVLPDIFTATQTSPTVGIARPATPQASTITTLVKPRFEFKFGQADSASLRASIVESYEDDASLGNASIESKLGDDLQLPLQQRVSFPRMARPPVLDSEMPSYFNHYIIVEPMTIHQSRDIYEPQMPISPSPSPLKIDGPPQRSTQCKLRKAPTEYPGSFSQSDEYFESYPSVVSESSYSSRHVPKEPGPIFEKIRRQRNTRKNLAKETAGILAQKAFKGDISVGGPVKRGHIEGFGGVDPRSNLHRELRDLFCGE